MIDHEKVSRLQAADEEARIWTGDAAMLFLPPRLAAVIGIGLADTVVTAINAMIESYNTMSEACNKLVEAYEKHVESEASRDLILGALTEQGTAMLDILQFAYANSSKLPQGIKDVINLKYANALKTLADEEKLLALVKQAKGTDNDLFDGKADE